MWFHAHMDAAVRRWSRRATLLAALGLAGCDLVWPFEDDSELPLLLDDPLAAKDLLGMVLLEDSQGGRRTTHLGSSDSTVRRVFRIESGRGEEAVAAVAQFATTAGWEPTVNPRFPEPRRWAGKKEEPHRECGVRISEEHMDELIVQLRIPH